MIRRLRSVVIEYLNFRESIASIEHPDSSQDNSRIEEIYKQINSLFDEKHKVYLFETIHPEDKKYVRDEIIDNHAIKIGIRELPILLNPWSGQRIVDNLLNINEDNIFDGERYSYNVRNNYLYPMDIVVCNGGNHSQFSARYKNQGKTVIKEIHDYSELYSKVEFDGENYIYRDNRKMIRLNSDYSKEIIFYSGILFELGRYALSDKQYSLDELKKILSNRE
ncbi:hypothetical protein J2T50_000307 [Streptococcus gallinaceus]|nr:DUF6710 family protein [Streptococcus gallinaceus]MCP1638614.1 hypothetical protein [Streptococcus gallinaceus]MCP1769299.1 hypothetical protein [Streptococcus gallinaceus]